MMIGRTPTRSLRDQDLGNTPLLPHTNAGSTDQLTAHPVEVAVTNSNVAVPDGRGTM